MGICTSCLGRRRAEAVDEDDESRLIFDDANNLNYGSFGDQNTNNQSDPLESQRETEALQRVVARTSNNLVDIFDIAPQEPQQAHPAILSGQDIRLARYHNILSKLSQDDEDLAGGVQIHGDWLPAEDDGEIALKAPIIKHAAPLVGTFADAAAGA